LRRTLVAVSAALALGGLVCGSASAQQPGKGITINIGYFPVVSPVPIMRAQHLLEDKGYTVNWVPINQGLPGAASAIAAGKLDIAWGNSISAVVIFSQSPDAAQFVGQSFVNANVTVVAKNSPIKSAKDIVHKKVVVSGLKTASTLFFQIGLKKAGVDPSANEYFVSGTGPGMVGVLDSGGAEVVAGYVPYVSEMVLKGIGRVLFTGSDAIGRPAPGDGFIASTKFIKEHPDAVKDVLRAHDRHRRDDREIAVVDRDALARLIGSLRGSRQRGDERERRAQGDERTTQTVHEFSSLVDDIMPVTTAIDVTASSAP
jgi:NitT/TauT family transport system substrate-binding protein